MRKTMGALALGFALVACGTTADDSSTPEVSDADGPRPWEQDPTEEPEIEPARDATADDFSLAVRVKSEQCFGSAGCNVEVEIVPSITDLSILAGRRTEVTYKLKGIEDSLIDTFEFDEEGSYREHEHRVSTTHADANITLEITSVIAR